MAPLQELFKARPARRRAKSRIRSRVAASPLSHALSHLQQALYANHNRKRGALRKESMR